jgi:superfamily II DNA or RNA helicase
MDKPTVILEQRHNRLFIYCPNNSTVEKVKKFLTFHRSIMAVKPVDPPIYIPQQLLPFAKARQQTVGWKTGRKKLQRILTTEPCYKLTNQPLAIDCPVGFRRLLVKQFAEQFDLKRRDLIPPDWLTHNTTPDWSNLDPNTVFRQGQKEILEKLVENQRGRIIIPTGSGKSFLITCYAQILPIAKILVSTFAKTVMRQLFDNLQKVLGMQAGLITGDTVINPNARVLCITQGCLAGYVAPNTKQDFDVVIIDECHEWGSARRLEILDSIQYAKLFGLSANETRPDKAEFRIAGYFGPVLAEMSYDQAIDKNLVTPITVVWIPVNSLINPMEHCPPSVKMRHGLWQYQLRNNAIAAAAKMFKDKQVLISVETLEHALYLREYLPDYEIVYTHTDINRQKKFLHTGLLKQSDIRDKKQLLKIKNDFATGKVQKVIATATWQRGVDFPNLQVLIRADGSTSNIAATQWAGRTARKTTEKERAFVIDFTDQYDYAMHARATKRRKAYEKHNWEQLPLIDAKYKYKIGKETK